MVDYTHNVMGTSLQYMNTRSQRVMGYGGYNSNYFRNVEYLCEWILGMVKQCVDSEWYQLLSIAAQEYRWGGHQCFPGWCCLEGFCSLVQWLWWSGIVWPMKF